MASFITLLWKNDLASGSQLSYLLYSDILTIVDLHKRDLTDTEINFRSVSPIWCPHCLRPVIHTQFSLASTTYVYGQCMIVVISWKNKMKSIYIQTLHSNLVGVPKSSHLRTPVYGISLTVHPFWLHTCVQCVIDSMLTRYR